MIYTSYFANWRNFPKESLQVSLSLYSPKGFKGISLKELFPSKELLEGYKSGVVSEAQYIEIYNKQLSKLDKEEILSKLYKLLEVYQVKNILLLCYEKKSDFCHRHLVGEWLEIKEL